VIGQFKFPARQPYARRVVWTLIDNGKLANQIARLTAIVVKLTNRMWFSVVWTLTDNGTRHRSDQNVVDSGGAASEFATNFFYHNIKDHERNLCQDFTDLDLKHYPNELLVRVRLSCQELLQTRSTRRNNAKKNVREKSNEEYSCR